MDRTTMNTAPDPSSQTDIRPDVLDELHRRIVAIHYGLAEHGPTEPKETVRWALAELSDVTAYIRAIKKAGSASSVT
jgi:hypothetical protein